MKRAFFITIVAAALAGAAWYSGLFSRAPSAATAPEAGGFGPPGGGRRGGGPGAFGAASFGRAPMTVEVGMVTRTSLAEQVTVVGNLVGDATVTVVPRVAGRLQEIYVRLGDPVSRGQRIAKIEDFELLEQVKQAEAAQEVSLATIRQREADLKLAETNAERSRSLFERQLLPKQTLDDNEARYLSALAQLDLARAQAAQSKARLDELHITLANTVIVSPVNGFVARRSADPGAFVSQNAPIADVVDIGRVRLVVNIVERDLRQIAAGDEALVQVDAYPGENFTGRIARVAPVLDPATRTAPIEIEIPNSDFRLKPGMYARVGITTGRSKDALVVPVNAVIDLGGRRGVFIPLNNQAVFRSVQIGSEQRNFIEILGGLSEGDRVITTGAGSLRDGDSILFVDGEEGYGPRDLGGPGPAATRPSGGPGGGAVGAARPGANYERPEGGQAEGRAGVQFRPGARSGAEGGLRRGGGGSAQPSSVTP
jgi:membrane fusion protein, multidrug efflux system